MAIGARAIRPKCRLNIYALCYSTSTGFISTLVLDKLPKICYYMVTYEGRRSDSWRIGCDKERGTKSEWGYLKKCGLRRRCHIRRRMTRVARVRSRTAARFPTQVTMRRFL